MKLITLFYRIYAYPFLLLTILLLPSCAKEVKSETVVYSNDFESGDFKNITSGAVTDIFNGTHVLGRYNLGGFSLALSDLPKHKLVKVSFDLYLHDSWNGNDLGIYEGKVYSGPDIWKLLIDHSSYINTTFSNSSCIPGPGLFCPPQSYPDNYPNSFHNAKTGAYRSDLPGACQLINTNNGSTLYKIEKTINHTNSSILIQCADELKQLDATDKKCDESWSVDNIKVTVIDL